MERSIPLRKSSSRIAEANLGSPKKISEVQVVFLKGLTSSGTFFREMKLAEVSHRDKGGPADRQRRIHVPGGSTMILWVMGLLAMFALAVVHSLTVDFVKWQLRRIWRRWRKR